MTPSWQEAVLERTFSRRDPETGRCSAGVGDIELPPTPVLERRALQIVHGCLVRERWNEEEEGVSWWRAAKDSPGTFQIEAKYGEGSRMVDWKITFSEAGDDELSWTWAMTYDHALAWLIAVAEEHHAEFRGEDLRCVGGLA